MTPWYLTCGRASPTDEEGVSQWMGSVALAQCGYSRWEFGICLWILIARIRAQPLTPSIRGVCVMSSRKKGEHSRWRRMLQGLLVWQLLILRGNHVVGAEVDPAAMLWDGRAAVGQTDPQIPFGGGHVVAFLVCKEHPCGHGPNPASFGQVHPKVI